MYYGMHELWTNGWVVMAPLMLAVWLPLLIGVAWLARRTLGPTPVAANDPRTIAQRRYAAGEITRDQYLVSCKTLANHLEVRRDPSRPAPADRLSDRATSERPDGQLRRTLNLWQVTSSGAGIVLGAGIYVLIGQATQQAGAAVWASFALAAVLSMLTALSYAELVSMFPSSGGEFEFTRRAFNPALGFIAGWSMVAAYMVGAAAVSVGFTHYLRWFVDVDTRLAAALLLGALTLVVMSGMQRAIWVTVALSVCQVGGLLLVVIAGIPSIGTQSLIEGSTLGGIAGGAALIFFAFIGFDDITTLSDDTENPGYVMPRALLLTLAISAVFYVAVAIAAVSAVGAEGVAHAEQPLALVLQRNWGDNAGSLLAVMALAATTNTTLLLLTAASRMLYGMARGGALPARLGRISERGGAPVYAAAVTFAVALPFALSASIGVVAGATDVLVYVTFISVNASVIALRVRQPERARGFAIPFAVRGVPVTAVLGLVTIAGVAVFLAPASLLLGLVIVGAGVVVMAVQRWFNGPAAGTDGASR